ncbi:MULTISPECIES: cation:proton antiporter [Acidobacterium]|uniref:Transporter, CPA2 family n=1 Tax=Acidobacterium capsulatum (strain ATCC 51196 / DSM 11244 / BCRC 80197 / JCM 7670 / NBRC 15755 / NCIMB 13165 / 161) TaxID=240015 RepID=C1F9Q9_ACIC5|nr:MULTISPECIES: cation:proton antiporter [Acidobacterium]ACO34109.1 transporter, CPA2 family [Acidobacterium capsulatum ATCC 51196]HCT62262.1 cation:proton antiporter [Acidobacterium sp.]
MSLIQSLLLLLLLSRVLGEVVTRFGQPAMLGEIAAGIILGPSCLGYVHYTPEIKAIADIGVLLLVFLAGMEMNLSALVDSFRGRGAWVSAAGFIVPLLGGILLGYLFGMNDMRMAFLGLCIAITALPVSVRILMDLGKLQSNIGQRIVSAAVANDVVSLLILGVILDLKNAPATLEQFFLSIGESLGKALIFMIVFAVVARLIRRYSPTRLLKTSGPLERVLTGFKGDEVRFASILLFVIAFASFSELLGLDFVVGAFFGSMLLSHEALGKKNFKHIEQTASSVTMGFVGPVFFAAIGLEFDASSLRDWPLVAAVLAVSFAGKILGGYLGGRFAKLNQAESWALGVGLNGRGVMELVIANIALASGLIGRQLFTTLVLMAVVTTFATPMLLRIAFRYLERRQPEPMAAA